MATISDAWKTYSFSTESTEQILGELITLLTERGVDLRSTQSLKAGFEGLFNIEYCNLPNFERQSYILAPNHVSDFDALVMGLVNPRIKILSKREWVENQTLLQFLNLHYRVTGVDRTTKVSQARALVELIKYLEGEGEVRHVLMFPQGTISDVNNNSVERVQAGVFSLSAKAGVPVLPVFIEQPNFTRKSRIVFGTPLPIPGKKDDCRALWKDAVLALQNSLTPPARRPVLTEKHAHNNKPGDPFF